MPKIVDHDVRRREVTAVAAQLVATTGRTALTVRNVAAASGCSTTVVSHYFDDISHLLYEIYDLAAARARTRIEAVLVDDDTDVRGLIEAVLPLDEVRRNDWRIWFAFWSEALAIPAFAERQKLRARTMSDRIGQCLERRVGNGTLPPTTDIASVADRLGALIPGIASEAIFDPERWTPDHQRRVLGLELASLGLPDA